MNKDVVVIATDDCQRALYFLAQAAMNHDQIEIHYIPRYSPVVEYLLRLLRRAFGWVEVERGSKEVMNTKCIHNNSGYCGLKTADKLKCTEGVRSNCPTYKRKFEYPIMVNTIIIEKVGAIRGME